MATAVFFHAHPDDEAIATGGTIALAVRAGHRVVVVCATGGEHGERHGLASGDDLAAVRASELRASADLLGVHRVELLGYHDSGMEGESSNDHDHSFWRADVEEAAQRLASLLVEERADLLTCYDDNGGYGHPDHIQVHRVGVRAAQVAGVDVVYEATMDRDRIAEMMQMAAAAGMDGAFDDDEHDMVDRQAIGVEGSRITHEVDVVEVIEQKREAMSAHASQITADSWFLTLPEKTFAMAFGAEWYIRRGATVEAVRGSDIFADAMRADP